MELKGKMVLVTGATGGIGENIVSELDQQGASCILVSRNSDKLISLINKLKSKNHKYIATDLSNIKGIQKVVDEIKKEEFKIDVIVNAAGIGIYKAIGDVTYQDWSDSFAINVESPYFLTQKLLANHEKLESPLVLAIGSGAGVIPMAGRSLYCATKFALRGAMLSLAEEFTRTKIKICLITLGSTLTEFGPMTLNEKKKEMLEGRPYFTPEWVAKKLVEIIKDDNREVEYTLYPGDYGLGKWEKPNLF